MENCIASSNFLPVCSNCLKIIWQTVEATQEIENVDKRPKVTGARYSISPEKCPYCNSFFENIIIPTKLPFDNRRC